MSKVTMSKLFKSSGMGACILALLFVGSLFIIASGGGGDGDTGPGPAPAETANLSSGNADDALNSTVQTFDLIGPMSGVGGAFGPAAVGEAPDNNAPLRGVINRALALSPSAATGQAVPFETLACDNPGGTMDLPDVGDLSTAEKLAAVTSGAISLTAVYNNCVDGTVTVDGTMTIRFTGAFYIDPVDSSLGLDEPDSITITTSSFHFVDTADSNDFIMTGFQLEMGMGASSQTITMTGDIEGTAEGYPVDSSFHNLAIGMTEGASGESLTINGMLYSDCIGGWVTIATTTAIFVPDPPNALDCPTAGVLTVTAQGNIVSATINTNSTIDVSFNGTLVEQYADCDAIEGDCGL